MQNFDTVWKKETAEVGVYQQTTETVVAGCFPYQRKSESSSIVL